MRIFLKPILPVYRMHLILILSELSALMTLWWSSWVSPKEKSVIVPWSRFLLIIPIPYLHTIHDHLSMSYSPSHNLSLTFWDLISLFSHSPIKIKCLLFVPVVNVDWGNDLDPTERKWYVSVKNYIMSNAIWTLP